MSIKLMADVWEHADAKGSELLLLLAIADNANDSGEAWPGVKTLAKKTRLSKRNVQYLIRRLEIKGLLQVEEGKGPRGCNLFTPIIDRGCNPASEGVQSSVGGGAIAVAPKSSRTIKNQEEDSRLFEKGRRMLTPGSKAYAEAIG